MVYEQFGELKYRYCNREFWCKGYYVDTVGKNASRIAEYIQNQLKEDYLGEQLSISEVARSRAANNGSYAVGRTYYAFDALARIRGLCPHRKYHAFYAWQPVKEH